MRKTLIALLVAAVCLCAVNPVFAKDAEWAENDPYIAVYPPGSVADDACAIEYRGVDMGDSYLFPDHEFAAANGPIRMLMINGGFVPKAGITVENGSTLVPLRVVSENLGAKVEWNGDSRTVTVTDGGRVITLTIGDAEATVDGAAMKLGAPAKIAGGSTVVPLRFVAEALGAEVMYIPSLAFGASKGSDDMRKNVSLVVIERAVGGKAYTPEDGLAAVKRASQAEYELLLDYFKQDNRQFDGQTYRDYAPLAVKYANADIGRYYVYTLEGFESFRVLYNKYTGEIFGEKAGLPFLFISDGFPNISWMYQ